MQRTHSTVMLLVLLIQRAVCAQAPAAPVAGTVEVGTQGHLITSARVVYARENPGHPEPEALLAAEIEVIETPEGLSPPRPREVGRRIKLSELPTLNNPRFSDLGLTLLAPAITQKLKELGFVGVYAIPDTAQFRVVDGKVVDLRQPGETGVTMVVTTGQITEVRTIGLGSRLPTDETVNNPLHAKIRRRSPLKPHEEGEGKRNDLLRRKELDDYTFRLSRHPGRRADTAVSAPGDEPGAVTLDYLITENKPWLVFAQVSNTGSASTSRLRENFGFIHNDLSNNDDILSINYQTANFEDVHALLGSYKRPLGESEHWSWRVHATWYQYVASEVGRAGQDFEGTGWNVGGEVTWNFYQQRQLFLDLVGGAKYESVRVKNNFTGIEGDEGFFIPSLRLVLERNTDTARTNASAGLDFNIAGIAGTGEEEIVRLGRTDADKDFVVFRAEAAHSFFVEPLFIGEGQRLDEKYGGLANEVALSMRGQWTPSRLTPNEQQVAGGLYTVRGYPEGTTAGDTVLIGSAEYRYHIPRGLRPSAEPGNVFGTPFRFRPQYQYGPTDLDIIVKGFIDAARVTNQDRRSFEKDQSLLGAGIGLEVAFTRHLNVRVDWGFALRGLEDSTGAKTVRAGHNELQFVITGVY